ncbi:tail fiber domain-containing protein [Paenibacillus alvei]|uniref:Tail fiber domain-containing protein n=1 Tax=Paenibacillus alvei TaxID=44250 RepID=A0AAP6ZUI4_PAEAL|nr:tail fiber domain-containing protein [Paenibacillus alvei]MCY9580136.1 tail fiber domain-containing protein [Paenibacillus alvei]MCY9584311.1 tail fiber domain-containing protein [Paenibacillus alvei]NOJ70470.1 tail fiber domain-containing protein [Paenibacillus alvei]
MAGPPEYLESNQQNVAALNVTNFATVPPAPLINGYNPQRNIVFQVTNYGQAWALYGFYTPGDIFAEGDIFSRGVKLTSDKNTKENFSDVSTLQILDKLASMPIYTWNYKDEPSVRHIGPTAQDFQAAFELNKDDTYISSIDAQGIALAAIQGLNEKLKAENAELHAKLAKLEARLSALESKS